jgi:multiple sugar transport system ATP-binding protein
MSTVETRAITKVFSNVPAVSGIDLLAREGEFLVLVGPSGCGKTTLMRMIAGLEEPTSGEVLIGTRDVTNLPPRARNIAMVFQSYALYPHLSVYRNIAFPLRARKVHREEIVRRVHWAASMFHIEHLLNRRPRQLSGGERQRVALARAMVRQPDAFLLDEPLSNLDAKLRTLARDELRRFQRRIGTTTIYVTHDQVEAMGLGDRIVVLNEGRIRQIGTPAEIYREPADTFVATFMGSPPMNLVESGGVLLGFRPEDLAEQSSVSDDATMSLPVRITRVEYLGAECLIYGLLEPPFPERHVIARIFGAEGLRYVPDDRRELVVQQRDLKRFDARTGIRLDRAGR